MTRSWPAFKVFQQGLASWERYQAGDLDALTTAIQQYRAAIQRDPLFALAYYRLGLALQQDGQPGAAAKAFRSAVQIDPHFIAAHNALAFHLLNFDAYYQIVPAPVEIQVSSSKTQMLTRLHDARGIWEQLLMLQGSALSVPDTASAYYGLCLSSYYEGLYDDDKQKSVDYDLAYFYCQRAELFYMAMSRTDRSETLVKQAEASVLNLLGIIVEVRDQEKLETNTAPFQAFESSQVYTGIDEKFWHCSADVAEILRSDGSVISITLTLSSRPDHALRYYQQALALQPDDPVIRCNAASVDFARKNFDPMRRLFEDTATHLNLADEFRRRARNARSEVARRAFYLRSLQEYDVVIARNPTDVDALNGYAYTIWHWGLHGLANMLQSDICRNKARQPRSIGEVCNSLKAHTYAEDAVRLVSAQRSQIMEAMVRSTQGEILMMEGRALEALRELEHAYALAPRHPFSDEIRWEFAQARLCTTEMQMVKSYSGEALAALLLDQIRRNEELREHRPFTNNSPTLLEERPQCDPRVKEIINVLAQPRESLGSALRP
jgi:tetratricopeptide (TPR) repeat protein